MTPRTLLTVLACAMALVSPAGAQTAPVPMISAPETNQEAWSVLEPFETLELSARLARLGQERGDPWLLATAARLRLTQPVQARGESPSPADGRQDHGSAGAVEAWPDTATSWLDEAERLAEDDPGLLAYVASIRAMEPKGRAGGPVVSLARLGGGRTHRFQERFAPGRPAVVYVEGDGDASLGVTVTARGQVVCQNLAPGDVKLCTWTAAAPGDYRVEVRNLGAATNRYAYGTN